MAQTARKRTEAQRKPDNDKNANEPVLDEQEQEDQIAKIRQKNDKENAEARRTLDYGVLTVAFISAMHFFRQFDQPRDPWLIGLSALQLLLLPFSLSPAPARFLPFLKDPKPRTHQNVVLAQLAIFVLAFNTVYKRKVPWTDIMRWAAPEFVAGAVEMQRRGERDMIVRLAKLEAKKYPAPGA